MSARNLVIKKIFKLVIFTTTFFALGSILFSFEQRKFTSNLEKKESLNALNFSLKIDKVVFNKEVNNVKIVCDKKIKLTDCEKLAVLLTKARNRAQDYKTLLTKTIGLSDKDYFVKELVNYEKGFNSITKSTYGLSFTEAKLKGILSIEDFLNISKIEGDLESIKNQNLEITLESIKNKINLMLSLLENDFVKHENSNYIPNIFTNLNKLFYFLITFEICLFLLVNLMDIINNNADPNKDNEFNANNIQQKVKPLSISVLFTFLLMICGQFLLKKEANSEYITHCRRLNQQNINFLNTVKSYREIDLSQQLKYINSPIYCDKFIDINDKNEINRVSEIAIKNPSLNLEFQAFKATKLADNYQEKNQTQSEISRNLLFAMLILNVISLAFLALHLKIDSEDIG